jgi:hypothetical protein
MEAGNMFKGDGKDLRRSPESGHFCSPEVDRPLNMVQLGPIQSHALRKRLQILSLLV